MKKKERRKLKEFAKSEQWQGTQETAQNEFVKRFIFNNDLRKKDKKQVCTILLRKTK